MANNHRHPIRMWTRRAPTAAGAALLVPMRPRGLHHFRTSSVALRRCGMGKETISSKLRVSLDAPKLEAATTVPAGASKLRH